jgi:hypothetical protein
MNECEELKKALMSAEEAAAEFALRMYRRAGQMEMELEPLLGEMDHRHSSGKTSTNQFAQTAPFVCGPGLRLPALACVQTGSKCVMLPSGDRRDGDESIAGPVSTAGTFVLAWPASGRSGTV